jgi:PAS domain S-box-containing protein
MKPSMPSDSLPSNLLANSQLLSKESLYMLLDLVHLPLMVSKFADGEILYSNKAAAKLFETSVEEMIGGQTLRFYRREEERLSILQALQEYGELKDYRVEVQGVRGGAYVVRVNIALMRIDGEVVLVVSHREVTEEEELQYETQQKNELLEIATAGAGLSAWSWNPETNSVWWDDYHYELFEIPPTAPVSPELFLNRVHPKDRERVQEEQRRPITQGEYSSEFELSLPSGKRRVIRDFSRYLKIGNEWLVLGTSQDITADIKNKEALLEAQQLQTLAAKQIGLGFWTWDTETDEVWWDDEHFELFEIPRTTKIVRETYLERIHLRDRERVLQEQREILTKGVHYLDYELSLPSGKRRFIRDFARSIKIGERNMVIGTSQDITRDILDKESQEEKLELMRMASEIAGVGFWLQNSDGQEWWDPALQKLYQLQENEATNFERFMTRFHPQHAEEQRARVINADHKAREGDTSSELYWLQLPDGSEKIVRDYVGSYRKEGELRLLGIVQDVTQREQEREQLKREIELRKLASEGARLCHWYWVLDTNEAWWDDLHYHLFEVPLGTALISPEIFLSRVHPKDRERVRNDMQREVTDQIHTRDYELDLPSGRRAIIRDHSRLVKFGELSIILGTSQEITEDILLQEELEEKLALINASSELAKLGFWAENSSEAGNWWSESYKQLLQLQEEETTSFETFRSRLLPATEEVQGQVLLDADQQARSGTASTLLYQIQLPDLSQRWIRGFVSSVNTVTGRKTVGVAQDVTDFIEQQEILRRSERLSAVGQLASEINHDLQQPLSSIQIRADLLNRQVKSGEYTNLEKHITSILADLDRANQIVERSLMMVRQKEEPKPVKLSEVVSQISAVLERSLREANIYLIFRNFFEANSEEEPIVMAYGTELFLVIQNLLINAKESIEELGEFEGSRPSQIQIELLLKEPNLLSLSVIDSGAGISEEVLPRIFETLFSTKNYSQNTGLGLSVCRRIIEKHGGQIEVENRLGSLGAIFKVVLPCLDQVSS